MAADIKNKRQVPVKLLHGLPTRQLSCLEDPQDSRCFFTVSFSGDFTFRWISICLVSIFQCAVGASNFLFFGCSSNY